MISGPAMTATESLLSCAGSCCSTAMAAVVGCCLLALVMASIARGQQQVSTKTGLSAALSNTDKTQGKVLVDDLLCPITLELPWDPVTGEDGGIYERSAIEEYFSFQKDNGEIRSCYTNQAMGNRLLPAPHIKNHIGALIENGIITGDVTKTWKKKELEKKTMDELLKKAERGDMVAMEDVVQNYSRGFNGFPQDKKAAYTWAKRAHTTGSIMGMAMMGQLLLSGSGVAQNITEGLLYLSMAAGEGSDYAAYKLGMSMAKGKYGLKVDKAQAARLLKKSLNRDTCRHQHMTKGSKKLAKLELEKLRDMLPSCG